MTRRCGWVAVPPAGPGTVAMAFALVVISAGSAEARGCVGTPAPSPVAATPDTVPSLDRIRDLLGPEGDRAEGLTALAGFAASLPPARATFWTQVLAGVERTGPGLAPLLLEAAGAAEEGRGRAAARRLEGAVDEAREGDRSALLWLGALAVQGEDPADAARLRERIISEHPDGPEAPEAILRQARWLLDVGDDRARALALLEELIVERPDHPAAPQARALLLARRGG